MAHMFCSATEPRDRATQSGIDAISERGGERRWEGNRGFWRVQGAIFSPLGVPTSAREDSNSVSILNSLLKHEKIEKNVKKDNRYIKCVVQSI